MLIAPSREDSFHLPAIEAMASGLPVVVSGRAGVSELIQSDVHAVVVDDPTDTASLVAAAERLLGDPSLVERLTGNGRALAERCTWEANAERTAELIERELRTPRILVLATDPGARGGIQRATRVLLQRPDRSLQRRPGRDGRAPTSP